MLTAMSNAHHAQAHQTQSDADTLQFLQRMATRETVWTSIRRGAVAAIVGTLLGLVAVGTWVVVTDPLENAQDPLGGLVLMLAAAGVGTLFALIGYLAVALSNVQSRLSESATTWRPTAQVAASGLVVAPAVSLTVLGAVGLLLG